MGTSPHNQQRLPPHQQLLRGDRWPVVGQTQSLDDGSPWQLTITGLVKQPLTLSLAKLRQRGIEQRTLDIHCVTRWSKFDVTFGGVPLAAVLSDDIVDSSANYVSFVAHTERPHSSSLPLAEALRLDAMIAFESEGEPLAAEHGGPLRIVVPGKYFYKSVKWLRTIELLAVDRLGYWEAAAGYHNQADPWREQRYIAATISKQEAARLIAQRDFAGRDLLGLSAAKYDLTGLQAAGARLRHADFRGAKLVAADFSGANLSNARFAGADLTSAVFAGADLDGADLSLADLRGCDMTVSSMFGTTFGHELPDGTLADPARIDNSTRFDETTFDGLAEVQRRFIAAAKE